MNQRQRLVELLELSKGRGSAAIAEYMLANGVRIISTPEEYDYSSCPHKGKDGHCTILSSDICKDPFRTMPCGYFPEEIARRRSLMELSGDNTFRSVKK